MSTTTTTGRRSQARTEALGCILTDGLSYSWFKVHAMSSATCKAVVSVLDADENWVKQQVGPADVARGLRMYREYLEGKREGFKGEWKYRAADAVRAGVIEKEEDFVGTEHARARKDSYGWQTVTFDRTNGEDGDYDANTADTVMQFALLGEAIYG